MVWSQFFWAFHSATIPLFLNNFTNSKFMISLILGLPGLAGCIIPPIAGYLSDNNFSRFGRRGPYILFGILFAVLCILALPFRSSFVVVTLIAAVMYFSLRFAETPYRALLPDVTPPEQRSTASGTMNLLGSLGMIIYFFIASQIWDFHPKAVFMSVAFTLLIFVFIAVFLIREPKNYNSIKAEKAKTEPFSINKRGNFKSH
jgi:Na+/melibiose symporter-like transporter